MYNIEWLYDKLEDTQRREEISRHLADYLFSDYPFADEYAADDDLTFEEVFGADDERAQSSGE